MIIERKTERGVTFRRCGIEHIVAMPRTVRVCGDIDDATARQFADDMQAAWNTGQGIVPVTICSQGGEVEPTLSMISTIQRSDRPVLTIVDGAAFSAAAILFGFGDERVMSPHAAIMLHEISQAMCGKTEDVKVTAEELGRLNGLVFRMLANHIGKPPSYFLRQIASRRNTDWYLSADDALAQGLATHVGCARLEVDVTACLTMKLFRNSNGGRRQKHGKAKDSR